MALHEETMHWHKGSREVPVQWASSRTLHPMVATKDIKGNSSRTHLHKNVQPKHDCGTKPERQRQGQMRNRMGQGKGQREELPKREGQRQRQGPVVLGDGLEQGPREGQGNPALKFGTCKKRRPKGTRTQSTRCTRSGSTEIDDQ